MMNVQELNREELEELKCNYLFEIADGPLSYGELAAAADVPDETIFEYYAGVTFSPDDFFCNMEDE